MFMVSFTALRQRNGLGTVSSIPLPTIDYVTLSEQNHIPSVHLTRKFKLGFLLYLPICPPSYQNILYISLCSALYLLGYIPAHNRVYLADKDLNIYAYALSLNVVEYQTAVLRGDMDAANEILPTLPKSELNKVARFLESRGKFPRPITHIPKVITHWQLCLLFLCVVQTSKN